MTDENKTFVRIAFRLGHLKSVNTPEWQAQYDGLITALSAKGLTVYAVLEPSLAAGESPGDEWRLSYIQNAIFVINHYGDRVKFFEVLPGPTRLGPRGNNSLAPRPFGELLAAVYERVKGQGKNSDVVVIAGAVPFEDNGADYLKATVNTGLQSERWGKVKAATGSATPFNAVAIWPALPDEPTGMTADAFVPQVERIAQALDPFPAVERMTVYVSGFSWDDTSGGSYSETAIQAALDHLLAQNPRVREAAREAASEGPLPPRTRGAELPLRGGFAVFTRSSKRGIETGDARPSAPVADRFDFPMGPRDRPMPAPGYSDATGFCPQSYFDWMLRDFGRGAWHTGEDWNGPGACDNDLGLPIYAIASGLVVEAKFVSPAWGNLLLIEHTLPDGRQVWSQYAHLDRRMVDVGAVVERGQQIGTNGKGADNAWCAHLHFEIRKNRLAADIWQPSVSDKNWVFANYLVPTDFIRAHRTPQPEAEGLIVDNVETEQTTGVFIRSHTPHWFESFVGWNGTAWYTFASQSEAEFGEWTPRLPAAGRYRVDAYIPSWHATTRFANYQVTHAEGTSEVQVSQAIHNDEWVSLGTFNFAAEGSKVRLTDKTGEFDNLKLEVCFDAVRWVEEKAASGEIASGGGGGTGVDRGRETP